MGRKMTELELDILSIDSLRGLYEKHGLENKDISIGMAVKLRHEKKYESASQLFKRILQEDSSKDLHLAYLLSALEGNMPITNQDENNLSIQDERYYKYYLAYRASINGESSKCIIDIMSNCFEAFQSGSESEWLYLRNAIPLTKQITKPSQKEEKNLFFYWDSKDPPNEVVTNFDYHRSMDLFKVEVFDKETASSLLLNNFGYDTYNLFMGLRHPAEESDFFRLHVLYLKGGYYLDVDEKITSKKNFIDVFGGGVEDIYLLSDTGPVHNAFFGSKKGSLVLGECLNIIYHNCYLRPNLSMWAKTGPGVITRALSRLIHRNIISGGSNDFYLFPTNTFPSLFTAVDVSYRNDARDWRVFEAANS